MSEPNDNEPVEKTEAKLSTIDLLLIESGYTRVHLKYILVTSFILGFEGIQLVLLSALVIPISKFFKCTNFELELASAMIFIGVAGGSLLINFLTSSYDRIFLLKMSTTLMTLAQLILVFNESYAFFVVLRFIIGVFLGITTPIILSVLVEVIPISNRGFVLTNIWIGVGFGTGLLYLSILVFMRNYQIIGLKPVFIVCFAYHLLITIMCILLMKDSPRNLILKSQYKSAFQNLEELLCKKIYGSHLKRKIIREVKSQSFEHNKTQAFHNMFSEKYLGISLTLAFIWFFNSLSLYGAFTIFPLAMSSLNLLNSLGTIIIQASSGVLMLCGTLIGSILSENKKFGRRWTMLLSWITSLLASILFWAIPVSLPWVTLILSMLFGLGTNVVATFTAEIYPTKDRDKALGLFFAITRIGGILSQFIFVSTIMVNEIIPYIILSICFFIMSVLTIFISVETEGVPIDAPLNESLSIWQKILTSKEK